MQAVILAAGMGKRLKDLTKDNTKCMVKVNGVTLIERMLGQLELLRLERIIIVVGYQGDKLIKYIAQLHLDTPVIFLENKIYYKTNNIFSLLLAKDYLCQDNTLLLESDLIFEDSILEELVLDKRETLALVDKYEAWMDGSVVKIDENDTIRSFVPGNKFVFEDIPYYYKTVNIYKFGKEFSEKQYVPFLEAYIKALGNNEYYEQVLRVLTLLDDPIIKAKKINGKLWYEIDDIQDLDIASSIFMNDDAQKLKLIKEREGGYWRYPHLNDFSNSNNTFFPPLRLVNELKASTEKLMVSNSSGVEVNALLAAKNLGGISPENVVVVNSLMQAIEFIICVKKRKVGMPEILYQKYFVDNSLIAAEIIPFKNGSIVYNKEDLISFCKNKVISMLILMNPDDYSGNYIEASLMAELLSWCMDRDIEVILDESYCDFADEKISSFINHENLNKFSNLTIMKDISISHGIAGLSFGYVASSDLNVINIIKNNSMVWRINSFAEFYLQIEEKYYKDYMVSLEKLKKARSQFLKELEKIEYIKVTPTQSNICLCELIKKYSAIELTQILLKKYDILVKDVSMESDLHQYVRFSIKTEEENELLLAALRDLSCNNKLKSKILEI